MPGFRHRNRGKGRRGRPKIDAKITFVPELLSKESKNAEKNQVVVELRELEAMYLADFEGKSYEEIAEIMQVSRGTVNNLVKSCRKKLIDAVLNKKEVKII